MTEQTRTNRRQNLANFLLVISWIASMGMPIQSIADSNLPQEELPVSWQADADLTDVFFLDANLGWAVGSQGVILRTVNGGQDWLEVSQAQASIGRELALDDKIRAMRSGARTDWTGVADVGSGKSKSYRCRFDSIHFVDELHGWIAGGYVVPYVDRSHAVVLKTNDGGVSWRAVEGLVIPRIKRIHFSDRANGWAVGQMGNLYRTGIYFSSDAGESWSSQSSGEMNDWIDGQRTERGFVNLDASGKPGLIKANRYEQSVIMGGVDSRLAKLTMLNQTDGWAVGDDGAVLRTNNGGLSWTPLVSQDEDSRAGLKNLLRQFDFQCLSVSPTKIWFAGNPGSLVFSIDQSTGAISTHSTRIALPIHDLHFVDDQRGWVVGALGTIMSTADAGATWQIQRGRHRNVAMLGVAAEQAQLPLEALARFAGEDNLVCAAATLNFTPRDCSAQSVERLGCSTWLGNLGGGSDAAERSGTDTNAKVLASTRMEKMVRTIRMLQPRVIVCNSNFQTIWKNQGRSQFDPDPFLRDAIQSAANPSAFPDQLQLAHLQTWQVDRLAVRDITGTLTIDPQRMLAGSGSLIEDRIALSRSLLGLSLTSSDTPTYRVTSFTASGEISSNDLFAGLSQVGRTLPRRLGQAGMRGTLNSIQLANSKQKKLHEFAEFHFETSQDFRVWYQQVLSWTMSLEEDMAGVWLAQLAGQYLDSGKSELAANTLELLTNRMSDHGLAPAAMSWLVQYYASDEFGQIEFKRLNDLRVRQHQSLADSHRIGNLQLGNSPTQMTQVQSGGVSQLVWNPVSPSIDASGIRLDDPSAGRGHDDELALTALEDDILTEPDELPALSTEEIQAFFHSRWQKSSQLLARLGQRDPDLVHGRQYRLLESQIHRKLENASTAVAIWNQLSQTNLPDDELAIAVARELRLAGLVAAELGEHPIASAPAANRPHLDGSLNDPVWQLQLDTGQVRSFSRDFVDNGMFDASNQKPDLALFAYDHEYLYVGIVCQKLPGQFYQTSTEPRPRDPDLSRRDRVVISLDVDRDYRSANCFEVDYRGWAAEQCSGAKGWNPSWFVSQSAGTDSWTIELAIPLKEMVPREIAPETVWGIRLSRLVGNNQDVWAPNANSPVSHFSMNCVGEYGSWEGDWRRGLESRPAGFDLLEFKKE